MVKDATGRVTELRCTYDPATRGGDSPDGRKVKATLHWVSAGHAVDAEVRLYDYLFSTADAAEGGDVMRNLNPDSLVTVRDCKLEPSLAAATAGERFQFERKGYFCVDADSRPGALVFNRTVTLRDTWAKVAEKAGKCRRHRLRHVAWASSPWVASARPRRVCEPSEQSRSDLSVLVPRTSARFAIVTRASEGSTYRADATPRAGSPCHLRR